MTSTKSLHVVGLGLIGASVAMAFGNAGWRVTGEDQLASTVGEALDTNLIVGERPDQDVRLAIIATPAGAVVEVAQRLLRDHPGGDFIVSDVAGVKAAIVAAIDDPRFLGGHPMAGSEMRGIKGARADMFKGCNWVLSPTPRTSAELYSEVHGYLREIGANVVALDSNDHDRLVALASHVPHLVAGALMNEAADTAQEDAVLLQLAAGGFRDMTRIAAGDPFMWPDVLLDNRDAIIDTLAAFQARLSALRHSLEVRDRSSLELALSSASVARRQLPGRAVHSDDLAYLRVEIADRPGALATITTLASDEVVNIFDIEIAHHVETNRGTLLLAIDATRADEFVGQLRAANFVVGRER